MKVTKAVDVCERVSRKTTDIVFSGDEIYFSGDDQYFDRYENVRFDVFIEPKKNVSDIYRIPVRSPNWQGTF